MPDPTEDLDPTTPQPPDPNGENPTPPEEPPAEPDPAPEDTTEPAKPREPDNPPRPGARRQADPVAPEPGKSKGAKAAYADILAVIRNGKTPRGIIDDVKARCTEALAS